MQSVLLALSTSPTCLYRLVYTMKNDYRQIHNVHHVITILCIIHNTYDDSCIYMYTYMYMQGFITYCWGEGTSVTKVIGGERGHVGRYALWTQQLGTNVLFNSFVTYHHFLVLTLYQASLLWCAKASIKLSEKNWHLFLWWAWLCTNRHTAYAHIQSLNDFKGDFSLHRFMNTHVFDRVLATKHLITMPQSFANKQAIL